MRGEHKCTVAEDLSWGDHPRMRGEHVDVEKDFSDIWGSSPHARGAPRHLRCDRRARGIIPACAGSTLPTTLTPVTAEDHPRMRGEHAMVSPFASCPVGSSPHARGALAMREDVTWQGGIIPACAGSTRCISATAGSARDHPRMRGEHAAASLSERSMAGSSPHARGALEGGVEPAHLVGIIPACAGSTLGGARGLKREGDHPRMRGEHSSPIRRSLSNQGSSPHARGAHPDACLSAVTGGIIPACAGSTIRVSNTFSGYKDHPRMRGEHSGTPRW